MKKNSYEMVGEFHETFYHPIKKNGASLAKEDISDERVKLRVNLIAEEVFELVGAALSPEARKFMENAWEEMYRLGKDKNTDGEYSRDVVEVADALADIEYVINGFAHEAGINLPEVVEEVHSSNMSKLGEDGKPIYRDDNKIMKGPHYFKPDIAKILKLNK